METKQETCAERVYDQMTSREEDAQKYLENFEEDFALSIDTKTITTVCLSWGGPADYLEITHDGAGIESVVYRFSDWFDTATRTVSEDSPLYEYARFIVENQYA
jgi:hypothetical protein